VGAIVIPSFIFYINKYQIEPEEYEMRKKFGENFEDYCKKVDRWI
jgi:protein-S-isoprenylcysteine O-methyltransferase Ste14